MNEDNNCSVYNNTNLMHKKTNLRFKILKF